MDYDKPMGVPITFLDNYSPDQFEILGWARGTDEFNAWPTRRYEGARQIQIKADGTEAESNGGKVNTGPTLLLSKKPASGTYYKVKGVDGFLVQTYMRVIIRNRNPERPSA